MKKDKYDLLRDKTKRIVKEGKRLYRSKDNSWDTCGKGCASCLSAIARSNVDKKDFEYGGFDSSEDICMLDARDILAEELNLKIF